MRPWSQCKLTEALDREWRPGGRGKARSAQRGGGWGFAAAVFARARPMPLRFPNLGRDSRLKPIQRLKRSFPRLECALRGERPGRAEGEVLLDVLLPGRGSQPGSNGEHRRDDLLLQSYI